MIAEPLEKNLAEDIENGTVQIGWNKYVLIQLFGRRTICKLMQFFVLLLLEKRWASSFRPTTTGICWRPGRFGPSALIPWDQTSLWTIHYLRR